MARRPTWLLLFALAAGAPASVARSSPRARSGPRAAREAVPAVAAVDIDERLGARVPTDLAFTDSLGRRVRLAELLARGKPIVLVLAYYRCPMLCDLVLSGISRPLRELGWVPGKEFLGLTVSIDPQDTPAAAHLKQAAVLQALDRPQSEDGWPFLVGDRASVAALARAIGFEYAYDPGSQQFAHPAVVTVLSPDGRISRYLYGIDFRLLDVRLAVTEAARGAVGTIVDRVLLTCFRYEPSARRYGFYVSAVLKGGAGTVLAAVGLMLAVLWRRDSRRMRASR